MTIQYYYKLNLFLLVVGLFSSCESSDIPNSLNPIFSKDSATIVSLFSKAKINKDSSSFYIKQAQDISERSISIPGRALFLVLQGKEFLYSGNLDSVNRIANKGLKLNFDSSSIFYKGKFYNMKGQAEGLKKNGYASIEYYLKAENIYTAIKDSNSLAGIYSNIANTYFSLKDYYSANKYAAKAYRLKNTIKEPHIKTNIITTYALSLIKIKQSKQALLIEAESDSIASSTNNTLAKLASTIGFAEIYKSVHQLDTAIKYYQKCILLSQKTNVKHFELMGNLGLLSVYEEQNKPQEIIDNADNVLNLAEQLSNTDVLHTAKRLIGKAYAKQNDFQKAFMYLDESYTLYDSLAGVETQKNINELLIKYDSKRKENEILNQKYLLEKQKNKLKKSQLIILFVLLSFVTLLSLLFYIKKLNKEKLKRLELEKQKNVSDAYIIGENKERKRISFEIHDGIASMITAIILKLQANQDHKEEIIFLLQQLHEDSRRVSYHLRPVDFEDETLLEALDTLCRKLSTPSVDISFTSYSQQIALDQQKATLLYRIVQELINNALKHANCKSIFITIKKTATHKLQTIVHDDGVGSSINLESSGLETVKDRVKALNGTINIETQLNEGTTIIIEHDDN